MIRNFFISVTEETSPPPTETSIEPIRTTMPTTMPETTISEGKSAKFQYVYFMFMICFSILGQKYKEVCFEQFMIFNSLLVKQQHGKGFN